jgi:hypothetical protein
MTLLEEVRTQVDMGSHALSDLARSAMEKAPDVVEATVDELHRSIPHAFGQAHELGEQIATGVQERIAMHDIGVRQAHSLAKRARRPVGRPPMKSSGHAWRRTVSFIVFGLAVSVIVHRALKTRRRSEVVDVPTSSMPPRSHQSESTPYHTVSSDSGGAGGVYHDREDCPAGKRILSEHRVSGTGGRNRCKDCQSLAS